MAEKSKDVKNLSAVGAGVGAGHLTGGLLSNALSRYGRKAQNPIKDLHNIEIGDPVKAMKKYDKKWWQLWKTKKDVRRAKELKDLDPELIKSYIEKKKLNPRILFEAGAGRSLAYPETGGVLLKSRNPELALHELGHLADFRNPSKVRQKINIRRIPQIATLGLVPAALLLGDTLKQKTDNEKLKKSIGFIQNNAVLLSLLGFTVPNLYTEGKATASALSHIAKERGGKAALKSLKTLLPGLGTYAMKSLPLLAGAYLGKKLLVDKPVDKPVEKPVEKTAYTRYAIQDFSDQAPEDGPFLHRKAGGQPYDQVWYTPPSKMQKRGKRNRVADKKLRYRNRGTDIQNERFIDVDGLSIGANDYQTQRSVLPDMPLREYK